MDESNVWRQPSPQRHPHPLPAPPQDSNNMPTYLHSPQPQRPYGPRTLQNMDNRQSATTPGIDNLSEQAAGGGINGLAYSIASKNERESGVRALQAMHGHSSSRTNQSIQSYDSRNSNSQRSHPDDPFSSSNALSIPDSPYRDHETVQLSEYPYPYPRSTKSARSHISDIDNPYQRYSSPWDHRVTSHDFDPNDIADDGDDGFAATKSKRSKIVGGLDGQSAAAGGLFGGAFAARRPQSLTPSGEYNPVSAVDYHQELKGGGLPAYTKSKKRKKWMVIIGIAVLIAAAIAAAIVGGIFAERKGDGSGGPPGETAAQDDSTLLTSSSPEIQALMNNNNLHRVFPGMDYTPFNAQYPACLTNPPSQNNVTRDVAVLSQLTKTLRLYGTDCNQTDMVLTAFHQLGITDMKVWIGVWLDNNQTTNDRGLSTMYSILSEHGSSPFAGVIVGNEVLYRQDMSASALQSIISDVRSNLTSSNYNLPVAMADLGDNWSQYPSLATVVDAVMSNVHPFFAGTPSNQGAAWAWDFWQSHDIPLTKGTSKMNIISEIGWPSTGGTDCGHDPPCGPTEVHATASIDDMNVFMGDFICQSLANGTNYFWFEAFDEPWKVQFNTEYDQWEAKWGLMTPDRVLKTGLTIPSCGGQTV